MLIGFGIIGIYFIIAAGAALLCRRFIKIFDEVFRKILHFILLGSLGVWVFAFPTWWEAILAAVIFEVLVYPILLFFEKKKGYSEFVTERKKGELKSSLLVVFTMFIVITFVCWGWLGDRYLVLACVYAWGFGDAAAALIGKRFGKHKITWKHADGKKSWEGTIAMFVTSFLSVMVALLLRGGLVWTGYLLISGAVAVACTLTEFYSKNGIDTITCPLSAMSVLLPLLYVFGGLV